MLKPAFHIVEIFFYFFKRGIIIKIQITVSMKSFLDCHSRLVRESAFDKKTFRMDSRIRENDITRRE